MKIGTNVVLGMSIHIKLGTHEITKVSAAILKIKMVTFAIITDNIKACSINRIMILISTPFGVRKFIYAKFISPTASTGRHKTFKMADVLKDFFSRST